MKGRILFRLMVTIILAVIYYHVYLLNYNILGLIAILDFLVFGYTFVSEKGIEKFHTNTQENISRYFSICVWVAVIITLIIKSIILLFNKTEDWFDRNLTI